MYPFLPCIHRHMVIRESSGAERDQYPICLRSSVSDAKIHNVKTQSDSWKIKIPMIDNTMYVCIK